MAIISGRINSGSGSSKPLSEQIYEKTPIQEVQLALEPGETYYLKTSGLPAYDSSYGTDYTIIFYEPDSPVNGIGFENRQVDASGTMNVLLTAYTSMYDSIFQGHTYVYYNNAWKRHQVTINNGVTTVNFYDLTSAELERFYMVMTNRGNINDYDLAIACLQTEIDEDRYVTTGYTKETLGEKVDDLKNWVYESTTSAPSLLLHPNMEALKEYYDGMFNGQSRLIYGSYGTPSPDYIYITGYADDGEITSCYLTYYNSTEEKYYNYYSDVNNEYTPTNVWLKDGEHGEPISGVPNFTYDSSKVVNEFAFPFIYGTVTTITTLDQKINSISGGGSGGGGDQPQTGLLKNQIYDEITIGSGTLTDGETYTLPSSYDFDDFSEYTSQENIAYLDEENNNVLVYISDSGFKQVVCVKGETTYSYDNETDEWIYAIGEGDPAPYSGDITFEYDAQYLQTGMEDLVNLILGLGDGETTTVQQTLEQKLNEGIKSWIYDASAGTATNGTATFIQNVDLTGFVNPNENTALYNSYESGTYPFIYKNASNNWGDTYTVITGNQQGFALENGVWLDMSDWSTEVDVTQYTFEYDSSLAVPEYIDDLMRVITVAGSGSGQTLEQKINDFKNWTYEQTEGTSGDELVADTYTLPETYDMTQFNLPTGANFTMVYGPENAVITGNYNPFYYLVLTANGIIYQVPDAQNDTEIYYLNDGTGWINQDTSDPATELEFTLSAQDLAAPDLIHDENALKLILGLNPGTPASIITLDQKINEPLKGKLYDTVTTTITREDGDTIAPKLSFDMSQIQSNTIYDDQTNGVTISYVYQSPYNPGEPPIEYVQYYFSAFEWYRYNGLNWYDVNYETVTSLPTFTYDSSCVESAIDFEIVVGTTITNTNEQTLEQKLNSMGQIQSNWTQSDSDAVDYIRNKPTLGTAATVNTGTSAGNIPVLDSNGKLDTSILPALAITDTFVVNSQAAMLALTAEVGDVAVRTDLNKSYILKTDGASTLANWQELLTPTDAVTSVQGRTGAVTITQADLNIVYSATQPSNPVTGMIWIAPAS